eukprot:Em0442g3a
MASAAQREQLSRLEEIRPKATSTSRRKSTWKLLNATPSVLRECENAVIYTNRALCYLKLSKPRDALEDCEEALKMEPSNTKDSTGRHWLIKALQRYSGSLWNLKAVLNLDPSNVATHKEYFIVVDMWKKTTHDHSDTQPSGEEFEYVFFLHCTSNQTISKKSVIKRKTARAVEEMVVWLFEVVYYLMKECPSIDVGMDRRLESLITQGIIITHKGLHVLMEVLALTQKVQWSKSLVKLKQVQLASIFVIQRYLSCMLLAQLVLMSLKEIPPSLYQPILSFMEEFLLTPNYIADAMQEVNGFVWTTFLPHVRLLYTQEEEIERASALKLCSLEIVLLGLHSMLRRKNHCMVILNEGLVDYIVCLPSHVPETLRSKAQGLIQLLHLKGILQFILLV